MNKHWLFEKSTKRDSASAETWNEEGKETPLMPCVEWAEKVNVAFPGSLSTDERAAFENHATSCEACRSLLSDYEAVSALLQTIPIPEPPAGLPPRLLQLWEDESHDDKTMSADGQMVSQYAMVLAYRERRGSEEMEGIDNVIDQKTALPMNFYKPIKAQNSQWHRKHDLLAS